jgi:hypothetical protein
VANLWCVILTSKPSEESEKASIPSCSLYSPPWPLAVTFFALTLPACIIRMIRLGTEARAATTTISLGDITNCHWTLFLWANMSSALSFFLVSFQVHEKSILLALAPCATLLQYGKIQSWSIEWIFFHICDVPNGKSQHY